MGAVLHRAHAIAVSVGLLEAEAVMTGPSGGNGGSGRMLPHGEFLVNSFDAELGRVDAVLRYIQ